MTTLKVGELAYVRVQVPDVKQLCEFLTDFGLTCVETKNGIQYFRASDPQAYCYEIHEGPQKFLGFGFDVAEKSVLDELAQRDGLSIQPIAGPGHGNFVRLTEPNGYSVDLVYGRETVSEIEVARPLMNSGAQPLQRKGELYRVPPGQILPVKRLAHVVLGSSRVAETIAWFRETLGLLISDEIVAGPQDEAIGAFMRRDAGEEHVDHHILFVIQSPVDGLHHISFEVHDVDALLAENARLKAQGRYEHMWGIGRHFLGSQIFDYWRSPFGYLHEHWTDSDRLDASAATVRWNPHEGLATQWGDHASEAVRDATRP